MDKEKIKEILEFESDWCLDPTSVGRDDCGYESGSLACIECQAQQLQALIDEEVKEIFKFIEQFSALEQLPFRDGGIKIRILPEESYQALKQGELPEEKR